MSPFFYLSWLDYPIAVTPPRIVATHTVRHVSHQVFLVLRGHATIESTAADNTRSERLSSDSVGFFPGDGRRYTHSITSADGFAARVFCIPSGDVPTAPDTPATMLSPPNPEAISFDDGPLAAFLHRMPSCYDDRRPEGAGDEIAGHGVLSRLNELLGLRSVPIDRSARVFTPAAMSRVVAFIDAHLRDEFPPAGINAEVDLSPSHFAKKFRMSTGISLQRFINRRRIRRSIALLRSGAMPVVDVAKALGFSSQSHFTRVFSDAVGLAPRQFQRLQEGARR